MGRGSSGLSSKAGAGGSALDRIKEAYPNAVIGDIEDGKVTFKYSEKGREYTYNVDDYEGLADKLNVADGKGFEGNSFFGNTTQKSGDYFTMEKQVSSDGNTIAFATNNIVVRNGSPILITGENEGIYLKDKQYQGVGIKSNGNKVSDAIMVKITKSEYNNAKRYKVNSGDISVNDTSFEGLKKVAKAQQKAKNQYKAYKIAVYNNRIETSVGRKGKTIV